MKGRHSNLDTYNEHLQSNKTLQGIVVSTDSVASPEQRTRIISLMDTLNEEGILKKVIFYKLQNDRSVDLGKQSFSNPGSTPATQAYSQKAKKALRDLHQIVETFTSQNHDFFLIPFRAESPGSHTSSGNIYTKIAPS